MSSRIIPIIRKEFIHIRRDFRTLLIIFFMPVFMLLMYGYAINMEIQNIDLAVLDHSQSPMSRELVAAFQGSKFFTPRYFAGSESEIESLFQKGEAKAALIIPADLARTINGPLPTTVQVLIDASDSNTAQLMQNYINAVVQLYNAGRGLTAPFEVNTSIRYNPTLKSAYFFVPGLVALILMMISALLTSLTIAREKETGTMEQLLTTPVKPREILIGKLIPYVVIAFLDGALIVTIAVFLFDVPFVGSHLLLVLFGFVYIATALSLGILISSVTKTQQVAMMLAQTTTLLPAVMLSGFVFAIRNMPIPLQAISHIVPARYFVAIIRGIMLKGASIQVLSVQAVALVGLAALFMFIAARKFSTRIG